jgi:hypothetical protein
VIKIKIVLIIISIVGIIFTSSGPAIPNVQSASDERNNPQSTSDDNNTQTSDEGNNAQSTSDDGDNVLSFNQELLPGLSSSD